MTPKQVDAAKTCILEYDGGYAHKQATAGYVVYHPNQQVWFGRGCLLDKSEFATNNEAELQAVVLAIEDLLSRPVRPEVTHVIVYGDSLLVT